MSSFEQLIAAVLDAKWMNWDEEIMALEQVLQEALPAAHAPC